MAAQAHQIYVFERFPHHLDPAKFWADGFVLPFLLIVGLWLLLWPSASRQSRRKAAVAVHRGGGGHRPDRGGDQPAGPLRPGTGRRLDAVLLVSAGRRGGAAGPCPAERAVVRPAEDARGAGGRDRGGRLPRGRLRRAQTVFRPALRRTAGRWHWPGGRPVFGRPARPRAAALSPATAGGQAAKLQRLGRCLPLGVGPGAHPPDARFLIPRMAFTFKWYAGRGEVVNWKETPQDAASLVDWWERIQDIYATGKPPPLEKYYTSLADAGAPKLQELAKKYEADYLVTQVSLPMLPLPEVYKNESFVVYKMK